MVFQTSKEIVIDNRKNVDKIPPKNVSAIEIKGVQEKANNKPTETNLSLLRHALCK